MARRSLLWQISVPFIVILLLSLCAATWYAVHSTDALYRGRIVDDLESRARLFSSIVVQMLQEGRVAEIDPLCEQLGREAATRLTVILPSGQVIGDTQEKADRMENHASRPEIAEALRGKIGKASRLSSTVNEYFQYVAVPIMDQGRVAVVIRASTPLPAIGMAIRSAFAHMAVASFIIAIIAASAGISVFRRMNRDVRAIAEGMERFAKGELDSHIAPPSVEELCVITSTANRMATELNDQIQLITQQRNELDAILLSLEDAMIVVDLEQRILRMNRTAASILRADPINIDGKPLFELVRSTALLRRLEQLLAGKDQPEDELLMVVLEERSYRVRGATLRGLKDDCEGAVLILTDVTNLRKMEQVHRELLSNAAHELKTPITAIQGYAETLLEPSMEEADRQSFLQTLLQQAKRMGALVDDLLLVSRLDSEREQGLLDADYAPLSGLLGNAIETCQDMAKTRGVTVSCACEEGLEARVDARLLEQAVAQLLANAIQHSEPGGVVEVSAMRGGASITIGVEDHGKGIDASHLHRLFDTFYRVDSSRSRALGGTGLGLAIVKRVASVHGGRVSVSSTPGRGSVFEIHLPV